MKCGCLLFWSILFPDSHGVRREGLYDLKIEPLPTKRCAETHTLVITKPFRVKSESACC